MANFKLNKYNEGRNYFVILSLASTLLAIILLLFAVVGYRFDLISIKYALLVLTKYGVYISILGSGISLVALGYSIKIYNKIFSIIISLLSLTINITIITFFYNNIMALKSNPMINDISTNYEDIIDFRSYKGHNSFSDEHILLQKFGGFKMPNYSLSSLIINNKTKDEVYNESVKIITSMGFDITYNNIDEGIIECVDRSFWYGFEDDMIIRIEKLISDNIIIDVRSASRVGRSDFGKNSNRIRDFLKSLNSIN